MVVNCGEGGGRGGGVEGRRIQGRPSLSLSYIPSPHPPPPSPPPPLSVCRLKAWHVESSFSSLLQSYPLDSVSPCTWILVSTYPTLFGFVSPHRSFAAAGILPSTQSYVVPTESRPRRDPPSPFSHLPCFPFPLPHATLLAWVDFSWGFYAPSSFLRFDTRKAPSYLCLFQLGTRTFPACWRWTLGLGGGVGRLLSLRSSSSPPPPVKYPLPPPRRLLTLHPPPPSAW